MKPKLQRKGGAKGKQSRDKLHKFMVSVQNFVKSEGGQDEPEPHGYMEMLAKRKSRKEMRKEKRKLKKKKRMKVKQPAEENEQSVSVDTAPHKAPPAIKTKPQSPCAGAELTDREKKPKRKVYFEKTAHQPEKKAKVQMMRKKALMEANEMEDQEIKKLEKRLGLHKRRNKKSLPQSFISDGLDYILGILEPGGSGFYDSDEDVESAKAKSRLKKLEEEEDHDDELDEGEEEDEEEDRDDEGKEEEDHDDRVDEGKEEDHDDEGEEEEDHDDEVDESEEEEDHDEGDESEEDEDTGENEDIEKGEGASGEDDEENTQDKSSVSQYGRQNNQWLF